MHRAQDILQHTFGYNQFRPPQAEIIDALLNDSDVLTLMPTGAGKSLCYQIPALVRDGVGVVVSPLIALMQDQVDALRQVGIRAAFLNSSLDYRSARETERAVQNTELDLIYIAPERLLTEATLQLLDQSKLALFAIDEAHCVSQWGHDFRPEYRQLRVLAERYPAVPRIALTATADQRTRAEIIKELRLERAKVFITSFDRPNIRYTISEQCSNAREQLWRFLLQEHPEDAGIVYCLSRQKVEDVAEWLNRHGRVALPYHAGLDAAIRRQNQTRFLRDDGVIVVATIAFGMGIDKPDVRFVAHLNLPKSIESYYQETGRAGRDGEPANAWMAYGLQDVITLRQMLLQTEAEEQYKRVAQHKLEAMLGLCELTTCRRQSLLAYFDEQRAEPCGNCDNCLVPPETWDGTVVAQKALSCVYRTGQRFGVNYLIDVLTGKTTDERIRLNRHDQQSTFGIGTELNEQEWRSVFRQLIAHGHLDVDMERHGGLRLAAKSRVLLKGEERIALRKQPEPQKPRRAERQAATTTTVRPADVELWEALRALRTRLAKEQSVPPYVIFHDTTLQEMLRLHPETLNQFSRLNGVGEQKLQRYGQSFVDVIKAHPRSPLLNNSLSDTVNETLFLYSQGMNVAAIAAARNLKAPTIHGHFADAIAAGLLSCQSVLELTENDYVRIRGALTQHNALQEKRLKPVFDALNEEYDYGILKCVLAEMSEG